MIITFIERYFFSLSASEDSLHKNLGISAGHATGCGLQEIHRAAGQ